jgi:secreted PhoX family phosphatase
VVAAAAGFIAAGGALAGSAVAGETAGAGRSPRSRRPLLGFTAVEPNALDQVTVPEGYETQVLIPWGTSIRPSGPAWQKDASNSAADQELQVGMHHDANCYFPIGHGRDANRRGLLVTNHEYTDNTLLYTDGNATMTQEKVDKALAAHGVSIVEIATGHGGDWRVVESQYARRITGNTPVGFSGPVSADHPMLRSGLPVRGTLNNCSYGETPWGTYLACEENFNGYFGTTDPTWTPDPLQARYGISAAGFGYRWHEADPRFDIAVNPKEANRFGWVTEIDPFKPHEKPVKRTALGRFKHEGATVWEARGRVIVYSGDDENRDYVYKYVSKTSWKLLRALGRSPLDHGTLYVAKFNDDGTGTWLPLVHGVGPLTAANGWADQADVLIRTRQAATAVGATPLHRAEWISVHPETNEVFMTLTNGSTPASVPVEAVNARASNPYGHIIKWSYKHGDNTRLDFEWDIFLLAGDPQYDPTVSLDEADIFGSPDGLWFDPDGRLWIQTDISNSSQNLATRGYDRIGNNQMLVADPRTGEVRRFLVGPRGAEITGIDMTPDQRTMFVNVQHPGESTTAWGSPTPANPRAVSNWPDFDPDGRPRAATVVVRKVDGGIIGT